MSKLGAPGLSAMEAMAANITYRPAVIVDAGAMALTYLRGDAANEEMALPTRVSAGEDYVRTQSWVEQKLSLRETWGFVALGGEQVVGMVMGWPSTRQHNLISDPNGEYLAELAIEPGYWGRGIGSTLLDHASVNARLALGRTHISLWVKEKNLRARALYERKGYAQSGNIPLESKYGNLLLYDLVF